MFFSLSTGARKRLSALAALGSLAMIAGGGLGTPPRASGRELRG